MEDKNNSDPINITPNTDIHTGRYYRETATSIYHYHNYFHEIRLSIFYISAVCAAVPCLIWAFYLVHLQKKTRGRISAYIILLLITDLLQLVLYPYIVSKLLSFTIFRQSILAAGYIYLKTCGLHLQQLVAFEGVLTLKYPHFSAHIFSLPCYIIISIIILLFPLMCILLAVFGGFQGLYLIFGSVLAPLCLLVVTGIINCKAPPTPASTPVTDHRPGTFIFLLTMITSVVLYLPCVMLLYLQILSFLIQKSWYVMFNCLLSLTVISEPLLCVLVCRANLRTQTQTHIELNCEQTSV